jgi:hypothetical protein
LSKFDATKLAHPIHPLQDVKNAIGFAVCDPVAVDVKREAAGNPILEDGQPKDFVFQARAGENSRSFYERWEVIFAAHYRGT